ncbi:MAG: hypothetical protein H0V45_03390 [Actinobacteria bacterium]|nr:hypothetical protein [Actinomycetota bacterium]
MLSPRSLGFRLVAVSAALASLGPGFGLVDLSSPLFLHEGSEVLDVGYGSLAGIVLPAALLSQIRTPEHRIAGIQLVFLVAPAYLTAGVLGSDPTFYRFAAAAGAVGGLLAAVHPARETLLRPGRALRLPALLALVASGPLVLYGLERLADQRNGVPPIDSHAGLGAWAALAAAALAAALAALLAAVGTEGFTVPGFAAAAALAAWGIVTLRYPAHAGAEGRGWAVAACGWALAFGLAIERERRRATA